MNEQKTRDVAALALEHLREMQELVGDSKAEAKKAFLELYRWIPEWMENQAVLDAYEANGAEEGEIPPFFSEVCTYELLGKEQARTLRALMHSLGEALGLTYEDMHRAVGNDEDDERRRRKIKKEDPFDSDDFDALEVMIREEGIHFYHGSDQRVQVQRALRAIQAARSVYSAPHDPEWEYLRVGPSELRIGDEIVRRGSWVQVLGFFHDEEDKRWTEEGPTFSEVPVGSKELNYRDKPRSYLVKTNWSPRSGEDLRSDEEVVIRRRKNPETEALTG